MVAVRAMAQSLPSVLDRGRFSLWGASCATACVTSLWLTDPSSRTGSSASDLAFVVALTTSTSW
jgi:hypothetical protein